MSRTQELRAVSFRSLGEGGVGDDSLPRLPRIEEAQTPPNSQESSSGQSSSGSEEGDSQGSIDLLPQGCTTRGVLEDSSRVLRRLYTELSASSSAASYHYDQYRFSVAKRNTIKRQIKKTKEGLTASGFEDNDRPRKKQSGAIRN